MIIDKTGRANGKKILFLMGFCALLLASPATPCGGQERAVMVDPEHYLDALKAELKVEWPANRTINLVFHGHSVPAGYFKTPDVRTLEAYPHLVLKELKSLYPLAVVNVIVTAIGGENSVQGEKRFAADVLIHRPDVVFIDYALNDRGVSMEESEAALASMIRQAQSKNIKVILLTPTPDRAENFLDSQTPLAARSGQVKDLAARFGVGLVDSYGAFKAAAAAGAPIADFMSQGNHPNERGHQLVAAEILRFFR
jgi:acyl-CoA thioesterase I